MISSNNSNALLKIIEGNLSKNEVFEEEQLIQLIILHNIPGRILSCIEKHNLGKYFSSVFLQSLSDISKSFFYDVSANIDAVAETLTAIKNKDDRFPIVIKGFSNYLLTDNAIVIRRGDIDIVPVDIEEYISILSSSGYRMTKGPFLHEAGEYSKDGIEFDIHRFFPVYRYDEQIKNLKKLRGIPFEMPYEIIDYSMLKNNSFKSLKNHGIVVADANMMILIICSHSFMNYTNIWSISHREKSYIKLGELWDIFDLIKHPSYSEEKLSGYIKYFKAEDCVSWTGAILNELFNYNPLPCVTVPFENVNRVFPKCLWWHIWEYLPTTREQLLSNDWYDIGGVFEIIGENKIPLYSKQQAQQLFIKYSIGIIDLYFTVTDEMIIIDRAYIKKDINCHIRIDFGNMAVELSIFNDNIEIGGSSSDIYISTTSSELLIKKIANKFLIGYQFYTTEINELIVPVNA